MCENATPYVGHGGGSTGETKLAPTLVNHTVSCLRLVLAEIDGVDAMMVVGPFGCTKLAPKSVGHTFSLFEFNPCKG